MTTDRAHQLAEIRAWTRANEAARRAYHEDQIVAAGLCATCATRRRTGSSRQCWTCIKGGNAKAAARMRAKRARAKEKA